ncbi:unnamed protein product, partial [Ectocarpus sp. 12 AP-2014]
HGRGQVGQRWSSAVVLAGALLSSRPVSLAAVSPEAVCWNSIRRCIHTHGSFIPHRVAACCAAVFGAGAVCSANQSRHIKISVRPFLIKLPNNIVFGTWSRFR